MYCKLEVGRFFFFFFQAEDGIRDHCVTGVQTCALPISRRVGKPPSGLTLQRPPPPRLDMNMIWVPSGDHWGVSLTRDRTSRTWSTTARGDNGCCALAAEGRYAARLEASMRMRRRVRFMVQPS